MASVSVKLKVYFNFTETQNLCKQNFAGNC